MQIDKKNIAIEMLDAAICELLDHDRRFAAYNLAGVAEELLDRELEHSKRTSGIDLKVAMLNASREFFGEPTLARNKAITFLNETKNSIKHFKVREERFVPELSIDDVRLRIGCALAGVRMLRFALTPTMERFVASQERSITQ